MEDDRVKVTAILVPQGPVFPAFAFRFDTDAGSVAFSGDTWLSENVVRLARGADIFVHEAIDLEGPRPIASRVMDHVRKSHTSVADVGGVAERAGVGALVLGRLAQAATASCRRAAGGLARNRASTAGGAWARTSCGSRFSCMRMRIAEAVALSDLVQRYRRVEHQDSLLVVD